MIIFVLDVKYRFCGMQNNCKNCLKGALCAYNLSNGCIESQADFETFFVENVSIDRAA